MKYVTNQDMGRFVSFIDNNGVLRRGIIKTFPFNNKVDIESDGNVYECISAENIES